MHDVTQQEPLASALDRLPFQLHTDTRQTLVQGAAGYCAGATTVSYQTSALHYISMLYAACCADRILACLLTICRPLLEKRIHWCIHATTATVRHAWFAHTYVHFSIAGVHRPTPIQSVFFATYVYHDRRCC
jgi:hypothetical protein